MEESFKIDNDYKRNFQFWSIKFIIENYGSEIIEDVVCYQADLAWIMQCSEVYLFTVNEQKKRIIDTSPFTEAYVKSFHAGQEFCRVNYYDLNKPFDELRFKKLELDSKKPIADILIDGWQSINIKKDFEIISISTFKDFGYYSGIFYQYELLQEKLNSDTLELYELGKEVLKSKILQIIDDVDAKLDPLIKLQEELKPNLSLSEQEDIHDEESQRQYELEELYKDEIAESSDYDEHYAEYEEQQEKERNDYDTLLVKNTRYRALLAIYHARVHYINTINLSACISAINTKIDELTSFINSDLFENKYDKTSYDTLGFYNFYLNHIESIVKTPKSVDELDIVLVDITKNKGYHSPEFDELFSNIEMKNKVWKYMIEYHIINTDGNATKTLKPSFIVSFILAMQKTKMLPIAESKYSQIKAITKKIYIKEKRINDGSYVIKKDFETIMESLGKN